MTVKTVNNKLIFWFAIVTVIISLCYYMFFAQDTDIESLLQQAIPEATNFEQLNKEPLVYQALKDSEVIEYCAIDKATGYQSSVVMLAAIDLKGNVKNVSIVDQAETPSFFNKLIDEEFFTQFNDLKINNGFEFGENIDAVTGATVSSLAVTKAINKAVKYVGENQLNINVRDPYTKIEFGNKEIALIIVMAMAVYATYKRKAKIRTFVLIFSVVVLGFWYNAFITYGILVSLLGGSIPPPQNLGWYILVAGTLILVFITGKNLFCYWMCPFGAMQELIHKLGVNGFKPSPKIDKWARKLPGFFAWVAIVLAFLLGNLHIASFEPFATLFNQVGTGLQWLLLPFVLFTSLIINRFWCNHFCPVGYVMKLVAKLKRNGVALWKKVRVGKTISS